MHKITVTTQFLLESPAEDESSIRSAAFARISEGEYTTEIEEIEESTAQAFLIAQIFSTLEAKIALQNLTIRNLEQTLVHRIANLEEKEVK